MELIELNSALKNHTVCAMANFWPQDISTLQKDPKSMMVCIPINREFK
jgi:hypothetical protein